MDMLYSFSLPRGNKLYFVSTIRSDYPPTPRITPSIHGYCLNTLVPGLCSLLVPALAPSDFSFAHNYI